METKAGQRTRRSKKGSGRGRKTGKCSREEEKAGRKEAMGRRDGERKTRNEGGEKNRPISLQEEDPRGGAGHIARAQRWWEEPRGQRVRFASGDEHQPLWGERSAEPQGVLSTNTGCRRRQRFRRQRGVKRPVGSDGSHGRALQEGRGGQEPRAAAQGNLVRHLQRRVARRGGGTPRRRSGAVTTPRKGGRDASDSPRPGRTRQGRADAGEA